jgi:metallo-beta-lactamase family protein
MQVECLGAVGRVTGSCHLVKAGDYRILLDCGLIQGSRKDDALNREPFPFDLSRIDAVVLSHAHIDHSGRIPLLVKQGYTGPVFAHTATRALCDIMLRDSGYIHEQEAGRQNRRNREAGRSPVEALYTAADADAAMKQFRSVRYYRKFDVTPTIRARFTDAGHILGSSIVELWLTEGSDERKLVFSGDLGHAGAPILRDPDFVKSADLVLMESTYGDRNHRTWEETQAEVAEIVDITRHAKGNILIPAFAVGRSQLLLYWMAQHYEEAQLSRWRVFLDSPLAIRATSIYSRFINLFDPEARDLWQSTDIKSALPNLTFTRTANQSRELNFINSGAIIIAGSGMCTGGRIRHHLRHNLGNPNAHIVIVGYQAAGTPGRALVEGAKELRLFGATHKVAAKVHTIGGLSAHAGQSALLNWYDQFQERPPLVLVHGEPHAQQVLKDLVKQEFAAPVHIAEPGDVFDLGKPVPFSET